MKIYRKAVGAKRYFFWIYSAFNSIVPSITALLLGEATNQLLHAVNTQDFTPFVLIAVLMLIIQLINTVLREVNNMLSLTTWQDVYIYVSEHLAEKYIEIPLATRESKEFADKFDRVQDFGSSVASVSNNVINIVSSVIGLIAVLVSTFTVSPIVAIIIILSSIPYSILSLRLAAKQRRNWREFTKDRRVAFAIQQTLRSRLN